MIKDEDERSEVEDDEDEGKLYRHLSSSSFGQSDSQCRWRQQEKGCLTIVVRSVSVVSDVAAHVCST